MRWENGTDYIEIDSGISADGHGAVWHVESSLKLNDLPVGFRAQVPKTDEEGSNKLKRLVSGWAENNGYHLVTSDVD